MPSEVIRTDWTGMDLDSLETFIKETTDASTAELRYTARNKPIRVRINHKDYEFWITELKLDKTGMVMTIDPQF